MLLSGGCNLSGNEKRAPASATESKTVVNEADYFNSFLPLEKSIGDANSLKAKIQGLKKLRTAVRSTKRSGDIDYVYSLNGFQEYLSFIDVPTLKLDNCEPLRKIIFDNIGPHESEACLADTPPYIRETIKVLYLFCPNKRPDLDRNCVKEN